MNKDKALGMLVGLHVGDCLGIPLEFKPPQHEDAWYDEIVGGGAFNFPAGVGSDDTDLMLCILRSIAENKEFVLHDIAKKLVVWKNTNPPDIGNTTRMGIRNIEKGEMLSECGLADDRSQGNGSIMRCAPMALLEHFTKEDVIAQAKLTHGHIVCQECDIIFLTALRYALWGRPKEDILSTALRACKNEVIKKEIDRMMKLEWDVLPNSGWCVHSLGASLWALQNCPNFETGVLSIINRGDDADTGGAVAGALLGAYYGYEAIPKRWVEKLQSVDEIKELLDKVMS